MLEKEERLKREIAELDAVIAEVNAIAGDLIKDEINPSQEKAREEVIELLGVNYVGTKIFNKICAPKSEEVGWFKRVLQNFYPWKWAVQVEAIPELFKEPEPDWVKLKEILNEPDEWLGGKKKFETYALVYVPPISFWELRERANEAAERLGKTPIIVRHEDGHFDLTEQPFAHEVPETGRYELLRRDRVPGSNDWNFETQKKLIDPHSNLSVTTLPALAAMMVGQYLGSGIRIYDGEHHYGRTATKSADGRPLLLGNMRDHGALVLDYDAAHGVVIGLAVSRNLSECFGGSA